jgi:hypothetical protein
MLQLPYENEAELSTTGDVAKALYDGTTYDHALPQGWVDWCRRRGIEARGRFVWGYPSGAGLAGMPLPLTVEAMIDLGKLAS